MGSYYSSCTAYCDKYRLPGHSGQYTRQCPPFDNQTATPNASSSSNASILYYGCLRACRVCSEDDDHSICLGGGSHNAFNCDAAGLSRDAQIILILVPHAVLFVTSFLLLISLSRLERGKDVDRKRRWILEESAREKLRQAGVDEDELPVSIINPPEYSKGTSQTPKSKVRPSSERMSSSTLDSVATVATVTSLNLNVEDSSNVTIVREKRATGLTKFFQDHAAGCFAIGIVTFFVSPISAFLWAFDILFSVEDFERVHNASKNL